ncbi:hypothetical protein DACRYDRAFT_102705 [Dacryopinax primogenitus]|uniref:FAD-binding PCMH-type domain-containing protein n=1 Tax=Dacryopinax primogenitus (strain DJM 731) TaxID=1858805 RepID=M5FUU4_DACPD|nr:uncharacterized protein DACRYDRAFT_102705 [Dacryopinax primogenitus]EJT97046.1 hypothetical protein DACRYDRAFT_102705 [Dacryopinax primogenitus]
MQIGEMPPEPEGWTMPFPDTYDESYSKPITDEMVLELQGSVKGEVVTRDDPKYHKCVYTFNRGLRSPAQLVVRPVDAEDVSVTILFCKKHGLYPSAKAGGYGTHGWSVAGDVVIDLGGMRDMHFATDRITIREWEKDGKLKGKEVPVAAPLAGYRRDRNDSEGDDDDERRRRPKMAQSTEVPNGSAIPHADGEVPHLNHVTASGQDLISRIPPSALRMGNGFGYVNDSTSIAPLNQGPFRFGSSNTNFDAFSLSQATGPFNPYGMPSGTSWTLFPSDPEPSNGASPFNFGSSPSGPSGSSSSALHIGPSVTPATNSTPYLGLTYPHPHAYILVSPGVPQKHIDNYTASQQLPAITSSGTRVLVPYHAPLAAHPVGSAVLLLAGFGFQSRMRGLSCDSLVEVEMVLADGRIVIVNENENANLWWAIRGCGPAFGIVTRYVIKAYPIPICFAGNLLYKFNTATTPSLISHYRDTIKSSPRSLYANVLLTAGPPGLPGIVVIQICFFGPRSEGQPILDAILSWPGEACLLNEVAEKSFLSQQDSVERVLRSAGGEHYAEGGMEGRSWFLRNAMISGLGDDVISETVRRFAETTDGCTWLFELAGGVLPDLSEGCISQATREAAFTVVAFHKWPSFGGDEDCIKTGEAWIQDVMGPIASGGPLPSFAERCEKLARITATYGEENFTRLCRLKQEYDSTGLFRHTLWPLRKDGRPVMDPSDEGLDRPFEEFPRARQIVSLEASPESGDSATGTA